MRWLALCLIPLCTLKADGLSDLRAALGRLPGTTPVRGSFEVQSWRKDGDGKTAREQNGQASAWVEDGPEGLRLGWSRAFMNQVAQEGRAKEKEPRTPAIQGLEGMGPRKVQTQIHVADRLLKDLQEAQLVSEGRESLDGRSLRTVTLSIPKDSLPEKERKMIKEWESTVKVWMDADGTPVAAQSHMRLKGRAFVVVSFQQESNTEARFQKVGNRLVCVSEEITSSGSGAGESGQSRTRRLFKVG